MVKFDANEFADRRVNVTVSEEDAAMMHRIERFILAYDGDNLMHDIDLNFPFASYRAFFLAYGRARNPGRWINPKTKGGVR